MRNFFMSKWFIALSSIVVGAVAVLGYQHFTHKEEPKLAAIDRSFGLPRSQVDPFLNDLFNDDFFSHPADPFQEMRRMRERMKKHFDQDEGGGGGVFDRWWTKRFGGGDSGEIKQREDKNFVYYDLYTKNVNPEKLKVKVENGQITIDGQVEHKSEEGNNQSFFSSSFHRSFPVPPEVDGNKVKMEQEKDRLVLKFPKVEPGKTIKRDDDTV